MSEGGLVVVGCDFRVAPSTLRARLLLEPDEVVHLASELRSHAWARGLVVLETCNRSEWIASAQDPVWAGELLKGRMLALLGDPRLRPYVHTGDDAARHVLRVAIGQESLVQGERQIAGQLFRAMEASRELGTSCRFLNGLGTVAGRLVRAASARGIVGSSARGVHSLAVQWVRSHIPRGRVAVVGLGAIGRQASHVLDLDPNLHPVRLNRSPRPGALPLTQLAEVVAEVDAVLLCTAAPAPVLRAEHLAGRDRPLYVADIGVPPQHAAGLPHAVVAGLDELTAFHLSRDEGEDARRRAEADTLVHRAMAEYAWVLEAPSFTEALDAVHRRRWALVHEELSRRVDDRLHHLDPADRATVTEVLRGLVGETTQELFTAIREATRRGTEEDEWPAR